MHRVFRVSAAGPGIILLGIMLAGFAMSIAAILLATQTRWLGVSITTQTDHDALQVITAAGPASALPTPSRLLAVRVENASQANGGALNDSTRATLSALDLTEDPSLLASFAEVREFYARQGVLATLIAQPSIILEGLDARGQLFEFTVEPAPVRPVQSLPLVFWVQIAAGLIGLLIGSWVWVLRPADWGARMFGATGVAMLGFTLPAAVYSTRELALDPMLFSVLGAINMAGALLFGCALIAIFLCFPTQLVRPARLWLIPAVFSIVYFGDLWHWWPGPLGNLATLVQTMIALLCMLAQWRVTRHDARARAALRWLGLSALLGAALFVVPQAATHLGGTLPPMSQGYGFVFFLIMYAGLALGVTRFRLFDLYAWAFRVLLWVGGVLALLAVDALLIWVLHLAPAIALGLALLIVGFLYLPLRNWLWQRLVARRGIDEDELFRGMLDVALQQNDAQRAQQWQALLHRLFSPLELTADTSRSGTSGNQVSHDDDGLSLRVPAVAGSHALLLRYPWRGRGLFGTTQTRLAQRLVAFMRHADDSRENFARGVEQERQRITRDLHDDIGARLISTLHRSQDDETRSVLRATLHDLRVILSGMSGEPINLAQLLSDLQHESNERLNDAGIAAIWHMPEQDIPSLALDYPTCRNLKSAQREVVSNILRHAGRCRVEFELGLDDNRLTLAITDFREPGNQSQPAPADHSGRQLGLANIRHRLAEIGGDFDISISDDRTRATLSAPLPIARPCAPPTLAAVP